MLRKLIVLAVAVLQVGVFCGLIAWRVLDWNEIGWVGMAYQLDTEADDDPTRAPFFWGTNPRQIEMVVPGGPAARAGVTAGDRVVSVEGLPVAEFDAIAEIAERSRTGDTLLYEIESGGTVRSIALELDRPYGLPIIALTTAASITAGIVFLAISLLVTWSRSRSRVALVFFLMCVFGAGEYLVLAIFELDFPDMRGIAPATVDPLAFVGLGLLMLFGVALINALLHLSLLFPRARPVVERWPQVFIWIHTSPFVLIPFAAVLILAVLSSRTPVGLAVSAVAAACALSVGLVWLKRRAVDQGWLEAIRRRPWRVMGLFLLTAAPLAFAIRLLPRETASIVIGLIIAGSALASFAFIIGFSVIIVVTLVRSYRESGVDERRQVRWPLWGTLTAVGSSIVVVVIQLVLSLFMGQGGHVDYMTNMALGMIGKGLYVIIPISFAFGIVKYRLMDIDVIIKKTVVYTGVTGFILVVYLLLAGVSGLAIVRSVGVESQTATVIATLTVVALFVPVRNRIQRVVERFFFHREQDTEASVRRVTETTVSALSLEEMAIGVAEEIQRGLRCQTVAVLTRPPGREAFAPAATVGLPEERVGAVTIPADDPVFTVDGLHVDFRGDEWSADVERLIRTTRAVRGVVGRRGEDGVALIVVGRKLENVPFDDEDEVFLEAVAGQLVVGLGRLRGRRAEIEFGQAMQIQRSLLPSELPQISGFDIAARWQPAREVSGDYYDVIALGPSKLALCIGDVVGKGMPAALLMSNLQAAVKAVAVGGAEPAAVCTQVRSVVTSNLQGGKFVTFFFAVIDGEARRMTFTNCGHNLPILVRADGSVLRPAEGGPAFARLMRDLEYRQSELGLAAGDRLVLFTDGVSEAADTSGRQFGEDRLVELVTEHRGESAAELESLIATTVLDHANGELQDDLTLVVVAVE